MMAGQESTTKLSSRALHRLGVACGLAAGAWLGAAEAPTKLVTAGYSPFLISLGMVAGVFVARWTVPMALKGTTYILLDLREKRSEEHTSELQSLAYLVCRLLLEK